MLEYRCPFPQYLMIGFIFDIKYSPNVIGLDKIKRIKAAKCLLEILFFIRKHQGARVLSNE